MAVAVAMPKLGMTMEEGRVVTWLVELGGRVEKGAPLLVIESEKAEVEIEATASGVLRYVYIGPDETVPCGTLLAALTGTPDEPFEVDAFRAANDAPQAAKARSAPAAPSPEASASALPAARPGRKPVAPAARKLAHELGLDPAAIPGTGPGGRVTRSDVEAWARAREALVEVGGGVALEVPTQGEGDAVLLLPGFGTDVSAFARQVPALAEQHRVLGVNPRGVGLSDAPDVDVYAVGQSASDAAAVCDAPAHVVGASLGAALAIELALEHPDAVRSLALITPFAEASGRLVAVSETWTRIAETGDPELLASVLLPWLFSPRFLDDARARERTRRGLAASVARVPATTLARAAAGMRGWSGTRASELGRIGVPTLVIGAAGDLLTPDAERIAAAISGAHYVEIPEAGHAVGLEAPGAVNAALLEHLAACEAA